MNQQQLEILVERRVAAALAPLQRKLDALTGQQHHPVTRSDFTQPGKKTPRQIALASVGLVQKSDEGLQTPQPVDLNRTFEWIAGQDNQAPTQTAQSLFNQFYGGKKLTPRQMARASMGLPIGG